MAVKKQTTERSKSKNKSIDHASNILQEIIEKKQNEKKDKIKSLNKVLFSDADLWQFYTIVFEREEKWSTVEMEAIRYKEVDGRIERFIIKGKDAIEGSKRFEISNSVIYRPGDYYDSLSVADHNIDELWCLNKNNKKIMIQYNLENRLKAGEKITLGEIIKCVRDCNPLTEEQIKERARYKEMITKSKEQKKLVAKELTSVDTSPQSKVKTELKKVSEKKDTNLKPTKGKKVKTKRKTSEFAKKEQFEEVFKC